MRTKIQETAKKTSMELQSAVLGEYEHTILGELEVIVNKVRAMKLCPEYWTLTTPVYEDLSKTLGLTKMQILLLGTLIDEDNAVSWSELGNIYGISRIRMLTYYNEMIDMVHKQWVNRRVGKSRNKSISETFFVGYPVLCQLQQNKPFVPEEIEGLNSEQVQRRICRLVSDGLEEDFFDEEKMEEIKKIVCKNRNLEICQRIHNIKDIQSFRLLIFCIWAYCIRRDKSFHLACSHMYFFDQDWDNALEQASEGTGDLFDKKYIENGGDDGLADTDSIRLTNYGVKMLIVESRIKRSKYKREKTKGTQYSDIIQHKDIKPHELFFGSEELKDIERLEKLMDNNSFREVQKRLKEEGMRKGVACLFYGAPGTGKTELAKQLARQSKRDIMMVDISNIKNKWVGESEKAMKQVFTDYKNFCRSTSRTPILLFNECDAVLNKRSENTQSAVDKMENAIQNIILQELEDLEGIVGIVAK